MILVTGVSNSGKTHTLTTLAQAAPWLRHVRASGVLASIGRPLLDLTIASALANQRALAAELATRGVIVDANAFLDGHATLETTTGPFPLPDEAFDALAPAAIVHVEADPAAISRRSASRGPNWTLKQAVERQAAERAHAQAQARRLGVPYVAVNSGDVTALLVFIDTLHRGGPAGARR